MLRNLSSFIDSDQHSLLLTSQDILQHFSLLTTPYYKYNTPHFQGNFFGSDRVNTIHFIRYPDVSNPLIASFFIPSLTKKNDTLYDPFTGRGTFILEAVLHQRNAIGNDCNPLSSAVLKLRLDLPSKQAILDYLESIPFTTTKDQEQPFGKFFHPRTYAELLSLKEYFAKESLSPIESWIVKVILDRIVGQSKFFSKNTYVKTKHHQSG